MSGVYHTGIFGKIPVLLCLSILLLAGCKQQSQANPGGQAPSSVGSTPTGGMEMTINVSSDAFNEGENIPKKYSCDGDNISPVISWAGIPAGTQSLAMIMDDPDAPSGTFVHWVIYNLPSSMTTLPEGASGSGTQGANGARKLGFTGPCPPKGPAHRYFFKVYALDQKLSLKEGATKKDLENAMKGHILGQGQLMGKYGR
jgi:Raf kinase inhibitor-like YbhB/YbcL family protein